MTMGYEVGVMQTDGVFRYPGDLSFRLARTN